MIQVDEQRRMADEERKNRDHFDKLVDDRFVWHYVFETLKSLWS